MTLDELLFTLSQSSAKAEIVVDYKGGQLHITGASATTDGKLIALHAEGDRPCHIAKKILTN